ncbi:DUF4142 domain-containing protein [Sphingomonas sp.]|uniref:DUF4142 domain-containing protein n=1 Tax=Sphingomonas sp. TaxID=28214 RepID=UPI003CC5DDED
MLIAVLLAGAAVAQTLQAPSAGRMSATEVGIEPMMRLSTADYRALSHDNDAYAVAAAQIARRRAQRAPIRDLSAMLGADHARALAARGPAGAPAAPALRMPFARALQALDAVPADRFDALYLRQTLEAHRHAWALHAGYAADGADPALRTRAGADLALEEAHLHRLPMRPKPY